MIISMPLYLTTGKIKKKKRYINLNVYRNLHFQVNNQMKILYKELVMSQIKDLKLKKVRLEFTLHRGDMRRVDRSNILSVHEKFFSDALVDCGCLLDDSDSYIESTHYYTGDVDKDNPRVDIKIINV